MAGGMDDNNSREALEPIAEALRKMKIEAKAIFFDAYQGSYIAITKKGETFAKLWVQECFSRGKVKKDGAMFTKAYLEDENGSYSANPGDYFMMKENDKFKGMTLVTIDLQGVKKTKKNPSRKDLPESGSVRSTISYESEPDVVYVLEDEYSHASFEITVLASGGAVDVTDIREFVKAA
ncbi:MAG: hypothetical protein EOP06_02020 [Proteobacteria bacterium]|nr:MAG: hypothetical protein EOP06_02020 [Pseudomonadota bacterium]